MFLNEITLAIPSWDSTQFVSIATDERKDDDRRRAAAVAAVQSAELYAQKNGATENARPDIARLVSVFAAWLSG